MANWDDVNSILEDVMRRGGVLLPNQAFDGSNVYVGQALRYLNRALLQVGDENLWLWRAADTPGVIRINKALQVTGTVTQDSLAFVLDTALPVGTPVAAGWRVQLGNFWYRVVALSADRQTVTLDSGYDGDSATGASAWLLQDEYTVPAGADRILYIGDPYLNWSLDYQEPQAFRRDHPVPLVGDPRVWTWITETKLRVDQVPSTRTWRMEVEFESLLTPLVVGGAGSTIPLPANRRYVLADWALYFLLQDLDDTKADAAGTIARAGLETVKHTQTTKAGYAGRTGARYHEF